MKKLFSSILCLVLVLALSSCSGLLERFGSIGGSLLDTSETENGVGQGEYTPGTVTDTDWKSAWIGLQYTLTDGFDMLTLEELEQLMDLTADYIYKDPETGKDMIDYAKVNAIYEMQAVDNMGNNIIVMAEKVNFLVNSEEKYCDALKQQLGQQTNISGTFEDPVSYSIGEIEFLRMDATQSYSGVTVYQTYLIKKYDDRMVVIIISANDVSKIDTVLSSFAPYSE